MNNDASLMMNAIGNTFGADIFKEDEIETQEVLQLEEQQDEMSKKTNDALEYYLDRRHIWVIHQRKP